MAKENDTQAEIVFKAGDRVVIKRLDCEARVLDSRDSNRGTLHFVAYVDGNGSNRRKWVDPEALLHISEDAGETEEPDADKAGDENTDDAAAAAAADTAVGAEPPATDETETDTETADETES